MSEQLDHSQINLFYNAMLDAFDPATLDRMLSFKLGRRLHNVAATNVDFPTTVFQAIMTARMEGWLNKFIVHAREANPGNPKLLEFSQQFGLASTERALERLVVETSSFLDPSDWGSKLGETETRVCHLKIETNVGQLKGTGFLVASDLIFTNYHVVDAVIEGEQGRSTPEGLSARASDVTCLFDYKVMNGDVTYAGTPYRLAANWLVASSPNSPLEQLPPPNHLDYALLRLAGAPAKDNVGKKETGGMPRGFVPMPAAEPPLRPDSPVLIMQHPDGLPVKLAIETRSVIGLNENGTRVRYRTNTLRGSSGSPCFSENWDLIALHHSGDPNFDPEHKPDYNEGIPFKAILEHLQPEVRAQLGR
jgi:trypsin-like peptidase/effector-associated domain 1 (EAD1)-containing protein